MKNRLTATGLIVISLVFSHCKSGLVTTSNSCYNLISSAQSQNKAGNYSAALDNFNTVLKKCDAYDAKEKAYAGKAASLNGLKQYNDAMAAAGDGTSNSLLSAMSAASDALRPPTASLTPRPQRPTRWSDLTLFHGHPPAGASECRRGRHAWAGAHAFPEP